MRRWLFLGAGRLGDQAVLWGKRIVNRSQLDDTAQVERTQLLTAQDPLRDPFHVYAYKFSVFVPACFRASDTDRKALENILRNGRPAGTQAQIEYVEPRFRIGFQSMIGFDSVVGRYPAGVTLNEMQLGRATVLTAPPHKQGAPSLADRRTVAHRNDHATGIRYDPRDHWAISPGERSWLMHKTLLLRLPAPPAITGRLRATTTSPASCWSSGISPTRAVFIWRSCATTSSCCTAGEWSAVSKSKPHPNEACRDRFVCVEPGSAVDCCGHDIIVAEEECIDFTQFPEIKALKSNNDKEPHTLQICARFRECPTEDIPVLYDDCGCDDTKCAPNRILESYEIGIILDPPKQPEALHTPKFSWENSIAIAHAAAAVLHDASHRLYVLTADDPATIYQISTENHATITARTLTKKAVALGVSNDGKHLYAVVEPTSPATLHQLHVLDTTQPGMPDFNTNPLDLPNSSGSAVTLAVTPDGRLISLISSTGDVHRWPADLDTNPAPTAPELVKNLGAGAAGLTLSSDGKLGLS